MNSNKLKKLILESAEAAGFAPSPITLEHPHEIANGDYSTNIALVLAKKAGKNPREIAASIKEEIEKALPQEIEKVEVAGAGFINFYLSKNFFFCSASKHSSR